MVICDFETIINKNGDPIGRHIDYYIWCSQGENTVRAIENTTKEILMKMDFFKTAALACAVTLTAMVPSHADFNGLRFYQKNSANPASGQPYTYTSQYVDFISSSIAGRGWSFANIGGTSNLVYMQGQLVPVSSAGNNCIEISTGPGAFGNQDAQTVNADTRIFIYDPNGSPYTDVAVSDDINGGSNPYSRVRLWLGPSTSLPFKITPYSSGSNNIDFYYTVQRLNLTSSTACKASGVNFVDLTTTPRTYVNVTGF
jgi:hypothetical protein